MYTGNQPNEAGLQVATRRGDACGEQNSPLKSKPLCMYEIKGIWGLTYILQLQIQGSWKNFKTFKLLAKLIYEPKQQSF